MKIALVSLNSKWEDKKQNMERCELLIENANLASVDLIIFPEMSLTGFSFTNENMVEDENNSPTINFFRELAYENKINIIFGALIREEEEIYNSALCIDRLGNLVAKYKKIHLFSHALENLYLSSGNNITSATIDGISFGLSICYDLRFPSLFNLLSINSNILVNIANWPSQRINHWNVLLQARAIENQCIVLGVNRTGEDFTANTYEKSSQVVDLDGMNLVPITSYEEMDIYDIASDNIAKRRSIFNTNQDKRNELYNNLYERFMAK